MVKYSYITNDKGICGFIRKMTGKDVYLCESGLPYGSKEDNMNNLTEANLVFVMLENRIQADKNRKVLDRIKAKARYYSSAEWTDEQATDDYVIRASDYIERLKNQLPIIENTLANGTEAAFQYQFYYNCGNCHEPLRYDDKYCSCCGTKRGEGRFEPFARGNGTNILPCVRGICQRPSSYRT